MGDRTVVWSVPAVRRFVGWTAILFSPALWVGYWFFERGVHPDSISAYYYSHSMRSAFVVFLLTLGVALIYYQYDTIDNWASTIAGLCAIGVALFPMAPEKGAADWQLNVGKVHYACAALCFLALGYIALFLFTRPAKPLAQTRVNVSNAVHLIPGVRRLPETRAQLPPYLTKQKRWRNQIYEVCGVAIFACVALLAVVMFNWVRIPAQGHPVFWLETVAVWAFGWAWIIKGDGVPVLTDGPRTEPPAEPRTGPPARTSAGTSTTPQPKPPARTSPHPPTKTSPTPRPKPPAKSRPTVSARKSAKKR